MIRRTGVKRVLLIMMTSSALASSCALRQEAAPLVGKDAPREKPKPKVLQAEKNGVHLTLRYPSECVAGHALMVEVSVRNRSDKFFLYYVSSTDEVTFDVYQMRRGGWLAAPLTTYGKTKNLRAKGKPGRARRNISKVLPPGGGFTFTENLARLFDLSQAGSYRLEAKLDLYDGKTVLRTPQQVFKVTLPGIPPFIVSEKAVYKFERARPDISAVVTVLMDTKNKEALLRGLRDEAANILRLWGYKQLPDRLIDGLENPKEPELFRAICVAQLGNSLPQAGKKEKAKILIVVRRALDDRHSAVKRGALWVLTGAGDPKAAQTVESWLADPGADSVRETAIACARVLGLRKHIPAIRKHLRDSSEAVRIEAIGTLGQWRDEASRAAFADAAKSKSVSLRYAGKAALKCLGEKREKERR